MTLLFLPTYGIKAGKIIKTAYQFVLAFQKVIIRLNLDLDSDLMLINVKDSRHTTFDHVYNYVK